MAPRGRRVTGTTLLLLVPLVPLVLFGVARAAAPFSVLGVLFDDPWNYVIVAAIVIVAGAVLMVLRPVERFSARALFRMRDPTAEESARVEPLLARACDAAGIDRGRLVLLNPSRVVQRTVGLIGLRDSIDIVTNPRLHIVD